MPASEGTPVSNGHLRRKYGQRSFDFATQVAVMAIVNRTRDSFYDHGRTFAFGAAVTAAREAIDAGADWVDIGAVPFSPLAREVSEQEEIRLTAPLVEAIRAQTDAVVSVDTFRSGVARAALAAGADVINDTSRLSDPGMAATVAAAGAAVVITHSLAPPRQWLSKPSYGDVVSEVRESLLERAHYAESEGVAPDRIIIDPGHDLNKNTYDSLELTRRLNELNGSGYPLLVSVSNKDFIAETLGMPVEKVVPGTLAAVAVCVAQGARIVRVHNVAAVVAALAAIGPALRLAPLPPGPLT